MLLASPSCMWCPPSVCSVVPVEWRCVVCCLPRSDWVLPFTLFLSLLHCPFPSYRPLFLFCLVLPCLLWVGKCGGGGAYRSSLLFCLCVRCHSIVGLVLCLCDRVVSLWNGGVDLCWAERRVVSIVYTSSVLWCASRWQCVMAVAVCDECGSE